MTADLTLFVEIDVVLKEVLISLSYFSRDDISPFNASVVDRVPDREAPIRQDVFFGKRQSV